MVRTKIGICRNYLNYKTILLNNVGVCEGYNNSFMLIKKPHGPKQAVHLELEMTFTNPGSMTYTLRGLISCAFVEWLNMGRKQTR